MQEFSIAFGRVSRATFSANPELKTQITHLVDRAYFNLHSQSLSSADPQWASTISAAALQLCMDTRAQNLNPRELILLFENLIRVSEEHMREARRHAAMATNVFYLKETALDATLTEAETGAAYKRASPTVVGGKDMVVGRVQLEEPASS